MAAVRQLMRLAAIAGACGALVMLTSPARAQDNAGVGSEILTLTPTAARGALGLALRDRHLDGAFAARYAPLRSARIDGDWHWNDHHDHDWWWTRGKHHGSWRQQHDNHELPEPGTFGLYVSALLGGAFFLRARKPRSR